MKPGLISRKNLPQDIFSLTDRDQQIVLQSATLIHGLLLHLPILMTFRNLPLPILYLQWLDSEWPQFALTQPHFWPLIFLK